jgi:hypothetical protein
MQDSKKCFFPMSHGITLSKKQYPSKPDEQERMRVIPYAYEATKEVVWIRNFVSELGVVPSASSPMDLYYDNSGAIAQAKEPRAHKRVKHGLRRYHLICEIIG